MLCLDPGVIPSTALPSTNYYYLFFQILTSVLQENTTAVMMHPVVTPKDHTSAFVNWGIKEMDGIVKVRLVKCSLVRY